MERIKLNDMEIEKLIIIQSVIDVLGIDMFPASTSQAKGKIERLWNTFQDRLVTEFKLAKITNIDQANFFFDNIY